MVGFSRWKPAGAISRRTSARTPPYGVDSLTKTSIKYDGGYMEKDIPKVIEFCKNADAAAAQLAQEGE